MRNLFKNNFIFFAVLLTISTSSSSVLARDAQDQIDLIESLLSSSAKPQSQIVNPENDGVIRFHNKQILVFGSDPDPIKLSIQQFLQQFEAYSGRENLPQIGRPEQTTMILQHLLGSHSDISFACIKD